MTRAHTNADDPVSRCGWCGSDPLYVHYHDTEWGRPVSDDRRLFEKLCLEGFQAGLAWITILRKREHFRAAFDGFDFEKVARYTARHVTTLLGNVGIVRHRGKIESTINNAQRACDLIDERGSIGSLVWSYEPPDASRPRRLTPAVLSTLATTPESTALSRDLKKRGWTFVGPTTMYAAMQAMGVVNDHVETCHARAIVEKERSAFPRPR
ncbi:MAG: DNA-3-methyladenine glycosylase I [Gemmatimonadaceae bacterium]|nr:DNA-3-methyladenine glycosylase I [Gemmatimonadaceae bacterium]